MAVLIVMMASSGIPVKDLVKFMSGSRENEELRFTDKTLICMTDLQFYA